MFVPHKLSNYPSCSQAFNKYFSSSKMQLCILHSRMVTLPRREALHLICWVLRVLGRYRKEKDPKLIELSQLKEDWASWRILQEIASRVTVLFPSPESLQPRAFPPTTPKCLSPADIGLRLIPERGFTETVSLPGHSVPPQAMTGSGDGGSHFRGWDLSLWTTGASQRLGAGE